MKKVLVGSILSLITVSSFAHGYHGHWRHSGSNGWNWVVPAVIGGVVVYEITKPPVVQQPVIIQQNQVINDSNCSPWTQVQNSDGTITVTRTCIQR